MKFYVTIHSAIFLMLYNISVSNSQNIKTGQKGIQNYEVSIEVSPNIGNDIIKIKSWHEESIKLLHNKPMKSLRFVDSSIVLSHKIKNDPLISVTYILYGRVHTELFNIEHAIEYYYKDMEYISYLNKHMVQKDLHDYSDGFAGFVVKELEKEFNCVGVKIDSQVEAIRKDIKEENIEKILAAQKSILKRSTHLDGLLIASEKDYLKSNKG